MNNNMDMIRPRQDGEGRRDGIRDDLVEEHAGVGRLGLSAAKRRGAAGFHDNPRPRVKRGGEGTADWDTAASNCSTGNCVSDVIKRISSKSSNLQIWARTTRIEKFELDEGFQPYHTTSSSTTTATTTTTTTTSHSNQ